MIKVWLALLFCTTVVACASNPSINKTPSESVPSDAANYSDKKTAVQSEKLIKSPHGYVIKGPKGTFGGFIGDCASDENFPYYWECQRESAGDNYN